MFELVDGNPNPQADIRTTAHAISASQESLRIVAEFHGTMEEVILAMIDAKYAVQIAKAKAAELFSEFSTLEEIERESYRDREVWSITLGLPRDLKLLHPFTQLSADQVQYKRFLIDVKTGELIAVKLREVAWQ